MNKQCVELIIKNQNKWDHSLWDDVALSKLMTELEIKPIDVKRFDVKGNIFKQKIDIGKITNFDAELTIITIIQDLLKRTY